SRRESMPNTLMEAMMCGLPTVASCVGGVPEVASDCAMLFPPGDVAGLVQSLGAMIDCEDVRREFGRKAAQRGMEFTMERKVSKILGVYQMLVANRFGSQK
ncbi:MAG: glycosyltransferase, partial [Deltaproteobacteria bacterium]|nr:glycosyltransferase [Deltaproteobacteria bacterium]